MTLIKDIMISKVTVVTPEMKLWQVAELFIAKGYSGAPVVDGMHRVISIIGEGMLMRLAASEGLDATVAHCLPKMPTLDQMIKVGPDESFTHAYKLFLQHNIHRLPVVDGNGKLLGLISRGTILKIFVEAHYGKAIPTRK